MKKFLQRLITISNTAVITIFLSGIAGVVTFGNIAQAAPQTRTLSTGTADSSGKQGAKWRKVPFTAAQTGTATFRLTWSGNGNLRFQVFRANGSIIGGNITTGGSPKTYSTALTAATAYSVSIWAYSGVGTYTMTITENFPDSGDTTPPSVPANLSSDMQTASSIRLLWNPSTDNVGVSGYRLYRGTILAGSPNGTSYTDTGLSPETSYSYTVRAIDAAGNLSAASAVLSVSTLSGGPTDNEAPSVPTGLQSSNVTHNSATLSWNASTDNTAVTNYRIYRNATQVGTSSSTSFSDTNLTPETTYTYTVSALDAASNASDQSTGLIVVTSQAPAQTGKPNIVVINLDDMRTDSLQYMPKVKRWLQDAGTTFPNGYVSTPSCCPSRASLMSGRYVHNNRQFQHLVLGFDLNLTTQRYLHDNGYFTGHAGKFLHWLSLSQVAPYWDRWMYFKGGYDNVQMNTDGRTQRSNGYSTTITFDRGIDYIRDFESRNDSKPFYIHLTPVAPHSPSTPEAKYVGASVPAMQTVPSIDEADRSDKPSFVKNRNNTAASLSGTRAAMIRTLYSVDDQVDRLMLELQAKNELDNTLVIFTSDNGYMWGEHKLSSKFLPYKEAVSVPFIMRWPGHIAAGATDNRMVTHVDVSPTLLAAAGITQNYVAYDGKDILSGYSRPQALTEYYYDEGNGNKIPTWAAIRTPSYLYVEYYALNNSTSGVSFREYYDMVNDPYQLNNLFGDSSTANDPNASVLSAQLQAAKNCVGSACQ